MIVKKNMKFLSCALSLLLTVFSLTASSEIEIERVSQPEFSWYEPLFFKWGRSITGLSCSQEHFDQMLYAMFEQEAAAYEQESDDRIFLQAVLLDEIVGYISCQITDEHKILIRQIAYDPEKFDSVLIKELLFALFQVMPKVQNISVICPLFCPDLVNLFQELGFTKTDKIQLNDLSELCMAYELQVHAKCAMCQVLYAPDFWEQDLDDDSDWGFCDLDDQGNLIEEEIDPQDSYNG